MLNRSRLVSQVTVVGRSIAAPDRLTRLRQEIAVGKISGAVELANIEPRVEALTCQKLGLEPDTASTGDFARPPCRL